MVLYLRSSVGVGLERMLCARRLDRSTSVRGGEHGRTVFDSEAQNSIHGVAGCNSVGTVSRKYDFPSDVVGF